MMMMVINMWDKFVFQKIQWRSALMSPCIEMCKHKREESKRDRKTTGHQTCPLFPWWRQGGEHEGTAPETLFKQDILCLGKLSSTTQLKLSRFHLHIIFWRSPRITPSHVSQMTFHVPEIYTHDFSSLGKTFPISSPVPCVTPHHFGALFQILSKY